MLIKGNNATRELKSARGVCSPSTTTKSIDFGSILVIGPKVLGLNWFTYFVSKDFSVKKFFYQYLVLQFERLADNLAKPSEMHLVFRIFP